MLSMIPNSHPSLKPVSSSDARQDAPPQSTAALSQARRMVTYIPNPKESSRRMGRTRSQTKPENKGDGNHACLSVQSWKYKTTFEVYEVIMTAYFVKAPEVPREDSPFGKSFSEVKVEPISHSSGQESKYRKYMEQMHA